MAISPTQRTLKALKQMGYKCAVVERWLQHVWRAPGQGRGVRQDMFGIIDIIALTPTGVLGIQSTGRDFAGHHRMLTCEKQEACINWLITPGTALELWGWRKVKAKRGGKAMVWRERVRKYKLGDFIDDDIFN